MFDIDRIRAETSGYENAAHFNNSGPSLQPRVVVEAVIDHLLLEERMGGYEAEDYNHVALSRVYAASAELLGAKPAEIAFTANASDSWWRAFSSIPLERGDRVLVGHSGFQSGGFSLLQARERGVIVDLVPNDDAGESTLMPWIHDWETTSRRSCSHRSQCSTERSIQP